MEICKWYSVKGIKAFTQLKGDGDMQTAKMGPKEKEICK